MKEELKALYKYRELLYMIAYRDIRVRYKQSIMGFFWAILMPILIVMSGVVVRYAYALATHAPLKTSDIASVAVKSVPWAFVVSSIRFTCNSLTGNRDLVVKVYFPKEIFPMAAVLACLFDFFVAYAALVVLLIFMKIGTSIYLLWVPVLLCTLVLLCMGIGMLVSAASLFFRDVKYIVEVFLTFGIFFTPVLYDVSMLGSRGKWLLLNPIAPLLEGLNTAIAHHQSPDVHWYLYSLGFSLVVFSSGFVLFKDLEPAFAESI
jgi:ABC-type polysaccharide/polyol phosphate export permease